MLRSEESARHETLTKHSSVDHGRFMEVLHDLGVEKVRDTTKEGRAMNDDNAKSHAEVGPHEVSDEELSSMAGGVVAAAADEVSDLTAAQFSSHAQSYQSISSQAAAIHEQFVETLGKSNRAF